MAAISCGTVSAYSTTSRRRRRGFMVLAIKGKQVIDATGRAPIAGGVVLVEGERIAAVGPADQVSIPAGAERIDLPEDTILPGLIDAHSHVVLRERGGTAAEQHLPPDPG